MIFCPTCGNCLLLEKTQAQVRFYCKTCPYLFLVEQKISHKLYLEQKEVDDVLGGPDAWKGVDQTDAICPKCENQKAYFKQIQIRSADQPMTIFYMCSNSGCGYKWSEN